MSLINNSITELGLKIEIAFWRAMSKNELKYPGVTAYVTGVDDSSFNLVIDTQVDEKNITEAISRVREFFKRYKLPWTWITHTLNHPKNIDRLLLANGFQLIEEFPEMYLNLRHELPVHLLSGVTIEEVSAEDTLTEWIKPVRESFPSTDNAEQFRLLNAHLPHGPGTAFRHFVLLQKKVAITSVTLFVTPDAVMIHNLATKPIYRRQGLATLIMIYALREAQQLGIQHCFLDSSSSGYHLYAELGFEVCAISKAYTSLK